MQPDITWHQTEASKKQTGALLKLLVEMLQDRRLVNIGYGRDVLMDGGYGWHVRRLRIGILTLNWHARVCVCVCVCVQSREYTSRHRRHRGIGQEHGVSFFALKHSYTRTPHTGPSRRNECFDRIHINQVLSRAHTLIT